MTIHDQHPFADSSRDPVRSLRGRLGGAVTLWTAEGVPRPAGLTVSSVVVAPGEPACVVALLDPDSDLAAALEDSGRGVLHLLGWRHRQLAEMFAGLFPAPGGPFAHAEFLDSTWGPRLADAPAWAGLRLRDSRPQGWSALVVCELVHVELGPDEEPLEHRRGRYVRPGD